MFIVLEGIDGSGKSTLAKEMLEYLNNHSGPWKSKSIQLREPTRVSRYGLEIRKILQDPNNFSEQKNEELLELFMLDRKWDIKNNILPVVEKCNIIMDRYYYSTAAYQAKNNIQCIEIADTYFDDKEILQPDVIIYLRIEPQESINRINKRGESREAFENLKRLTTIKSNYEFLIGQPKYGDKTRTVSSQQSSQDCLMQSINQIIKNYHD